MDHQAQAHLVDQSTAHTLIPALRQAPAQAPARSVHQAVGQAPCLAQDQALALTRNPARAQDPLVPDHLPPPDPARLQMQAQAQAQAHGPAPTLELAQLHCPTPTPVQAPLPARARAHGPALVQARARSQDPELGLQAGLARRLARPQDRALGLVRVSVVGKGSKPELVQGPAWVKEGLELAMGLELVMGMLAGASTIKALHNPCFDGLYCNSAMSFRSGTKLNFSWEINFCN